MKQKIQNKINELNAEIAPLTISLEDSKAAEDKWFDYLTNLDKFVPSDLDGPEIKQWSEDARKCQIQKELDLLNRTMAADLVKVTTRYIITDETLVSPAGFHMTEKVFVKPNVCLLVDILPKHLGKGLYYYDMQAPEFNA